MNENDVFEKNEERVEYLSDGDEELNRESSLSVFSLAVSIAAFVLMIIGFLGGFAGLIGQSAYIMYVRENLDYLFWKIGGVILVINYVAAFICALTGAVTGRIAKENYLKKGLGRAGMITGIVGLAGFITYIPVITIGVYFMVLFISIPTLISQNW